MPRQGELQRWFVGQVSLGNLVIILAGVATAVLFYADTKSTAAQQAQSIEQLKQKLTESRSVDFQKEQLASAEREKLRTDVSTRVEKTAESLANLDKNTALLASQVASMREELTKIGQQITALTAKKTR